MSENPQKLFLVDGVGALISAFLLGVVLVNFEEVFGMPKDALYFLAILPIFFAAYDFICYFLKLDNWQPFLKVIAILNICYCILSIIEMTIHYDSLTKLGIAYFVGEIIIVFGLGLYELKVAKSGVITT